MRKKAGQGPLFFHARNSRPTTAKPSGRKGQNRPNYPTVQSKPPRSAQSRVAIFKRLSQLLARLAAGDERAHAVDELAWVAGHGGNGFARLQQAQATAFCVSRNQSQRCG